ncbi:unnamed protein product [Protopolystoma xenopodis]|uniref:Uncharacterized protein n=1 Tax=Protopolystoma xenopodis TaxID=117903 RepID=A0A448XC16_9PLAT|nr:unnamed protein product [Protopolystoma xenopodis]
MGNFFVIPLSYQIPEHLLLLILPKSRPNIYERKYLTPPDLVTLLLFLDMGVIKHFINCVRMTIPHQVAEPGILAKGSMCCNVLLRMTRLTDDADYDAGEMSGNLASLWFDSGN